MKPPIADPHETQKSQPEAGGVLKFQRRFLPYFFAVFLQVVVPSAIVIGVMIRPVFMFRTADFYMAMVTAIALLTATELLLCLCFMWALSVEVSAQGIIILDRWFAWREFVWSQIVGVELKWFFLPYAVISMANGKRISIPLILRDPRGFAQAVAAHTAPAHPLHEFLRQRDLLN